MLKLRDLDGKSVFLKEVPRGSFIVNCTDHISASSALWEPVVSSDGLVVAPQFIAGFSGPSATYATHLHYLGLLEGLWGDIPRLPIFQKDKAKGGLLLFLTTWVTSKNIGDSLPRDIAQVVNPRPSMFPLESLLPGFLRLRKLGPQLYARMQRIVPTRFSDECSGINELEPVLAGNIGTKAVSQHGEKSDIKPAVEPRARL